MKVTGRGISLWLQTLTFHSQLWKTEESCRDHFKQFRWYPFSFYFGFIVLKSPVGSWTRPISWSSFQSPLCLWCYHRCSRVRKCGGASWGVLTPTGLLQNLDFLFSRTMSPSHKTLWIPIFSEGYGEGTDIWQILSSMSLLRAWLGLGFMLISSWPICNCTIAIQRVYYMH